MIVEVIKWLDDMTSDAHLVTLGSYVFRNADKNTCASTRIMILVKYADRLSYSKLDILGWTILDPYFLKSGPLCYSIGNCVQLSAAKRSPTDTFVQSED